MPEKIAILGSTGSIGCSTLAVIATNPTRYSVSLLTANSNDQKLFEQCQQFHPKRVVMVCSKAAKRLQLRLTEFQLNIEVRTGADALEQAVDDSGIDIVVAAIVGAAGLLPTLASVKNGHKLLLANKEALVMSGELFMQQVKQYGATLLPVDSEHNAIFQSLPNNTNSSQPNLNGVHKILLTGSGGPFLNEPLDSLVDKTPDQACAHPNWVMGRKISVDSATMMNKGLELIEACYLFDVALEQIEIVIHPQSIIHSMVSYLDGSVIAQLGQPDMKTPIGHCLAWPERINTGVKPLDFYQMANLSFQQPDFERFPCLELAICAIKIGLNAPCTLNAANEVAVDAFLNCKIKFTQIAEVIDKVLLQTKFEKLTIIQDVINSDKQARELALAIIEELG